MTFTFLFLNSIRFKFQLLKRKILNCGAFFISYSRLKPILKGLSEDSTVIDCGANVGDITLLFAKTKAKVFAFEPDPLPYKVLKQRTKDFSNITCYQQAVSTSNGKTKMFFHKERTQLNHEAYSVSSSIIGEKENIDNSHYIKIEIIDLVEFIDSFNSRVALIKMDVEGAEIKILEKIIERETYEKVDLLLVETHETKIPGHDEKVARLKHLLETKNIKNIKLNWI
ncbi:MAG: FkbM family methyltransferase [Mariniphaga sp.]|nr:FkbM family methyltransferase [Mariniphaga sp.]